MSKQLRLCLNRGGVSPKMQGQYIYGDEISGRIWSLPSGTTPGQAMQPLDSPYAISSFAPGSDGELYALDYGGGRLLKLSFN